MENIKNIVFMLFIIVLLCIVIYAMYNDEYTGDNNKIYIGNDMYVEEIDKLAK